jgi:hypothetical protein
MQFSEQLKKIRSDHHKTIEDTINWLKDNGRIKK